jgi:cytochrome c peroxidase
MPFPDSPALPKATGQAWFAVKTQGSRRVTPLSTQGLFRNLSRLVAGLAVATLVGACSSGTDSADLDTTASLGEQIFTDRALSEPRGTACANCHQGNMGFAGNNGSAIGVALGAVPGALGLRNAMTNRYLANVPGFSFVTKDGATEATGGHFWDGRANTLEEQALGPLLNPLEMNNASKKAVVDKIAASTYAPLFKQVFGANVFDDVDKAFANIGTAIAAFERSGVMQPYTSKYDAVVRGNAKFSDQEARGMALFQDPVRANCAGCHLMNPSSGNPADSPFTEHTYYATGVPRNMAIPKNADPAFFDLGLCGPDRAPPALPGDVAGGVTIHNFCGQFKMPTLRNVAERPALMHNGQFRSMAETVRFYSTRISNPTRWYGPTGIANDLPAAYVGNIEKIKPPFNRSPEDGPVLNDQEVSDIVAFLRTLSDGYQ